MLYDALIMATVSYCIFVFQLAQLLSFPVAGLDFLPCRQPEQLAEPWRLAGGPVYTALLYYTNILYTVQ